MEGEGENKTVELSPDQVIGRVLVEIRQVGAINNAHGLDLATSYFVLDSGTVFCLPGEWATGLCNEPVPVEAQRLTGPIEAIYGQRIAALLRALPNSDLTNESLYLLLENGYLLSEVCGGWHGTSSVGVFVHEPGEIELDQLVRVW